MTQRKLFAGAASFGLLAVGVAGWYGLKASRPLAVEAPLENEARRSAEMKPAALTAGELLQEWFANSGPATASHDGKAVITISAPDSPARRKAFQHLLAGLNGGNAWELYEALAAADAEGAGALADAEWTSFLRKWGSIDPGALGQIAGRPETGWRAPALLYGVAVVDPAAALAWLEQEAPASDPPQWRTAALRELVLGWTTRNFDEPAEWIRGHRDDPAMDEVIAGYAKGVAPLDPERAFAWANAVEGSWRPHARECVAKEWLAADPAAATAKLLEMGYGQEELDQFVTDRDGQDITISGTGADIHLGE